QKYTLTGTMDHFKEPEIGFTLESPQVQLKGSLVKNDNTIMINALSGKYMNTAFDCKGNVLLNAGGPVFDISMTASLLLEELVKALPEAQKQGLANLNPTGTVSINADLKGTGADWKDYTAHAEITSPVISLMGYKLNGL